MWIRWDENKRQLVRRRRQIDFEDLKELLRLPYLAGQRIDPDQFRIVGWGII